MARPGAFAEARRVYRARPGHVLAVSALAYGGVAFLTLALFVAAGAYAVVPGLYLWIGSVFWLQAPLSRLVADERAGRAWRGARRTLESVFPRLGRITGAAALASLAVWTTGWLFFPLALLLLVRWSLLVPVLALEDDGMFAAFSRSRDLVRGHVGTVFVRILVSGLGLAAVWTVMVALFVLLGGLLTSGWLQLIAATAVTFAVLSTATPLIALSWTMTYYELRDAHAADAPERPRLHAGPTLDTAWSVYKRRPGRLVALGLFVGVPLTVALVALARLWPPLALVPLLAGYVWLEGLLVAGLGTLDEPSARTWLRGVLARAAPQLGALLLAGAVVGTVLLVTLPLLVGLFLLIRWSVTGAVVVAEGAGPFAALGRSNRLVSGQGRRALKVVLLSLLMAAVVFVGLAGLAPLDFGPVATYAFVAVAYALGAPYVAVAWALMYGELRRLVEAPATQAVA